MNWGSLIWPGIARIYIAKLQNPLTFFNQIHHTRMQSNILVQHTNASSDIGTPATLLFLNISQQTLKV
jgi:hypothetical protein